jgi:hypothetical protein
MRGKQNLFNVLAHDPSPQSTAGNTTSWKVKYFGTSPIVATLRELKKCCWIALYSVWSCFTQAL